MDLNKKFVITGGPGVGKSTLTDILAKMGFAIVPEAARIVISDSLANNSDCVPWKNLVAFQDSVAALQLRNESAAKGVVFCDRGIVDGHAYCKIGAIPTPKTILDLGPARYDGVFIIEPLPTYVKDEARREDPAMARQLQDALRQAYIDFGYSPISVPVLPPQERAQFVLDRIGGV